MALRRLVDVAGKEWRKVGEIDARYTVDRIARTDRAKIGSCRVWGSIQLVSNAILFVGKAKSEFIEQVWRKGICERAGKDPIVVEIRDRWNIQILRGEQGQVLEGVSGKALQLLVEALVDACIELIRVVATVPIGRIVIAETSLRGSDRLIVADIRQREQLQKRC